MKKVFFVLCLMSNFIAFSQKKVSVELMINDTLEFKDYVIKVNDTLILYLQILPREDIGMPYFKDIGAIDTLAKGSRLGVLEFIATEFNIERWRKYKGKVAIDDSKVKEREKEKKRIDRMIEEDKKKIKILKSDKN